MNYRRILFLQGGGAGTHDAWDNKLVDSLAGELGSDHQICYPRMPREDDPDPAAWGAEINRTLASWDAAVVVGHSVGGAILLSALADGTVQHSVRMIILLAAPFVGAGGWSGVGLEFPPDLGTRLPGGASVHLFHGSADPIVPPSHLELYGAAIPQATTHLLPGRDHQLGNDLREVATVVNAEGPDVQDRP